ncbi:MAG: MFS transporter [Chloroflexi bacterium]|nr:MFS transporter [Chloroflexota bacterium]
MSDDAASADTIDRNVAPDDRRAGGATGPEEGARTRWRLLATLLAAQVCGTTGHSISLAVLSIVAADLTGTNTWSGVPIAVAALGAAFGNLPLARVMGRFGRRPGLVLGYGVAILGSMISMAGIALRSFPLLLVGMVLFGIGNTSNLLSRYAASDVTTLVQRGRAIGLIVAGGAIGSIVGPNLLAPAERAAAPLGLPTISSPFLIAVLGFGLAAVLLELLLRPDPSTIAQRLHAASIGSVTTDSSDRIESLSAILRRPTVRIALAALMTSQLVMIGTTAISPVYLRDEGHNVHTIGLAVSAHLAGMFAVSPLTGWLCDRIGRQLVIVSGAFLLVLAVVLAALAPGSNGELVTLALFLNGVGWNFGFVGGSALLTDALSRAERTSVQGWADLVTGLMGALGSALGGMVLQAWGFPILNTLGALLVLGPLVVGGLYRASLARSTAPSKTISPA